MPDLTAANNALAGFPILQIAFGFAIAIAAVYMMFRGEKDSRRAGPPPDPMAIPPTYLFTVVADFRQQLSDINGTLGRIEEDMRPINDALNRQTMLLEQIERAAHERH